MLASADTSLRVTPRIKPQKYLLVDILDKVTGNGTAADNDALQQNANYPALACLLSEQGVFMATELRWHKRVKPLNPLPRFFLQMCELQMLNVGPQRYSYS